MAKYKIILILLSVFLLTDCSKDTILNPVLNTNSGAIVLKIDKENAPANIFTVTASLSREGFQTLTSNMNLHSDTTASIQFTQIPVGEWQLVVEAKDSLNEVKFRGETNVMIMDGIMTQVSLTLIPTATGFGSIEIFVTWGGGGNNTSGIWTDFINNPILFSSNSHFDYGGIHQPKVIYFNNKYRMYYVGNINNGMKYVLYAESDNGNVWNKPSLLPVLFPGSPGNWDSWAVHPGAVFVEGDLIKMYYCAWSNTNGRWDVGYATSLDGINWTKRNNPVIIGGSWDFQMVATSVVKVNNLYYLYYYGKGSGNFKVGLATSSDGINWTKHQGNPIMSVTKNWENLGISSPSVIYENGIFKMVYGNVGVTVNNAIGYATSTDGINWNKDINNPFFDISKTHNSWASKDIAYPNYVKIGNEYRVYYSGLANNSSLYRIGFVKRVD